MVYQRVTLSELEDRLEARTNGTFWEEREFSLALAEAVRCWQAMVGEWNTTVSIPVDGTHTNTYDVPKQICSLTRVSWNGAPLTMCAKSELEFGDPGWEGVPGTPTYWFPRGLNLMGIAPYPTSGTLSFEGFQEAPIMIAPGDFINLGDEELNKIMNYCLSYLSFKEGSSEMQSTIDFVKDYLEAAGEKNAKIRSSATYKRWMGIDRDKEERPIQSGEERAGARA